MNNTPTPAPNEEYAGAEELLQEPCTLHVCTSCRPPGAPREPKASRAGYMLYQELRSAVQGSPLKDLVQVQAAECLSVCRRPCGISLSRPGSWTYLFGDQHPTTGPHDILECISLYLESPKGFMARESRPKTLRGSILGRVPAIKGGN